MKRKGDSSSSSSSRNNDRGMESAEARRRHKVQLRKIVAITNAPLEVDFQTDQATTFLQAFSRRSSVASLNKNNSNDKTKTKTMERIGQNETFWNRYLIGIVRAV